MHLPENSDNGKKIGMVVAVEIEAVMEHLGDPVGEERYGTLPVTAYDLGSAMLYVAHSGAGEIGAAAATELLCFLYRVDMILNFGVVGGLTDEMKTAASALVEKVVHYDFDTSTIDHCEVGRYLELPDIYIPADRELLRKAAEAFPALPKVICASADKFVSDPEAKRELHRQYGASICDMESAAIALTAYRAGVPALLIKTVSDAVTGGAEEFLAACRRTASICMEMALRLAKEV